MGLRVVLFCLACSFNLQAEADLTSRFILQSDSSSSTVADVALPTAWWSRPHEYCWAAQFTGHNFVVLDAACGIPHPFKWHLGNTCRSAWACDTDWRITNTGQILEESKALGTEGCATVAQYLGENKVHLIQASITGLPSSMPRFDRIFCISTLEHLSSNDRQLALIEFARMLNPNGLAVITMDYPECKPEEMFQIAEKAGLTPAGPVIMGPPPEGALFSSAMGLHIYRLVLKRK